VGRATSARERTRARLDLARVLEESVKDPAQAQRAIEAAVKEDPTDPDSLAELERLAAANAGWEQAAEALASALESGGDLAPPARAELWVRLAHWRLDKTHDSRRAEEAYVKALAIEAENVEILRALEDIRRAPGRERELVETLRTRAKLETDLGTKRDLLREAKGLAEGPVGDRALAEATLRDLLAEDEGDLWALEELTKLRHEAGDEAEAVKLLMRRAELVVDGAESLRLKHEAAKTLVDSLKDVPRAISIYEEILEAEPSDAAAAAALRTLYGQAGRDKDLARLLSRLVDIAEAPAQRATLRLELAKLHETRFHAPEDAIEVLRAVLDEDPTHSEAVLALSQLYESTGKDAELADLLRAQLDSAKERGDQSAELAILVRLGEVQEGRLNDVAAAQETYELVLARDGSHRGALEAIARMSEKRADWDRASGALSQLLGLAVDAAGVPIALRLAEARDKLKDPAGAEEALQRGLKLEPSNTGLRAMLRVRLEKEEKWAELAALLVGDADLIAASSPPPEPKPDAVAPAPAAPQEKRKSMAPPSMAPPAAPPTPPSVLEQVKLLRRAAEIHQTKRKHAEDAIPLLERAAQLVPQDRELLLALCDSYNDSQRGREAAQVLEKVIASFGGKRTKELAVYHHRLARALSQLGDKDVALSQLDMAFKIDPGSVSVLRDLGVLAFETNDLERAQKTFRALLLQRLDAGTGISKGEVFYYLGEISVKQGDKAKAVQMFERAIENDPALERARTKLTELKS
jgi:tetratricopeptide (TPR) repeat protein